MGSCTGFYSPIRPKPIIQCLSDLPSKSLHQPVGLDLQHLNVLAQITGFALWSRGDLGLVEFRRHAVNIHLKIVPHEAKTLVIECLTTSCGTGHCLYHRSCTKSSQVLFIC